MIADLFLSSADVVGPLLRGRELAARWEEPSVLAEFRVRGLAGHLARAVFNVERYLDTDRPADAPRLDAVRYFLAADAGETDLDGPTARAIRDRGEQAAGDGPADLAERFDAARARLAPRLAGLPADHEVVVLDRWLLPLDQALITRLVELAVHLDDLTVSLDVPTPELPDEAADLVLITLARIARARHGAIPLLRALSRRERAPQVIAAF
ncbi:MAG: hypothetical protein GEV11_14960 [Streptosporangiales bacterium]|nr:hypothetical protein [Streptosporangiales bacterium]